MRIATVARFVVENCHGTIFYSDGTRTSSITSKEAARYCVSAAFSEGKLHQVEADLLFSQIIQSELPESDEAELCGGDSLPQESVFLTVREGLKMLSGQGKLH